MFEAHPIRSPGRSAAPLASVLTPSPSAFTRPTASWPRTSGVGIAIRPSCRCMSVPQTPASSTRATTAPGPGSLPGSSTTSSGRFGAGSTTARRVLMSSPFVSATAAARRRRCDRPGSRGRHPRWPGAHARCRAARSPARAPPSAVPAPGGDVLAVVERRRPPQRRPDLVAGLLHLWRQGRRGGSREVLGQLVRARDTEQDAADERAAQQPTEGQLQQGQTGVAGYLSQRVDGRELLVVPIALAIHGAEVRCEPSTLLRASQVGVLATEQTTGERVVHHVV